MSLPPLEEENYKQLSYQIGFDPKYRTLLIKVFFEKSLITSFEQFGIHALGLNFLDKHRGDLDPEHRRFAQNLLRFARLNSNDGYYVIPKKHVAFFISKLARFPQVGLLNNGKKINFSANFLMPITELLEQTASQVRLKLKFYDPIQDEDLSLNDAKIYSGTRSWLFHQGKFFPIKNTLLNDYLTDFSAEGELTLHGEEAVEFIQEILVTLQRKPQVILPAGYQVPDIVDLAGSPKIQLEEDENKEQLNLELHFSYGEHLVPPHQESSEALVQVTVGDKIIGIRRDLVLEKKIIQQLIEAGFQRTGLTHFETRGERAFDFLSTQTQSLQEKGYLTNPPQLNRFRFMGEVSETHMEGKVVKSGTDWFEVKIGFEIDGVPISYEVIQAMMAEGRKYLQIPEKGFVKIEADSLRRFEEKLLEVEGEVDSSGKVKLSNFHASFFSEMVKLDYKQYSILQEMVESLKKAEGIPSLALPAGLETILRDYQHHGFNWLHFLNQYHLHGILADDMGLGKTVQALSYLKSKKDREGQAPNLVIAPTSVIFNWAEEAKKFTPEMNVLVWNGPDRKKFVDQIPQADILLTSYALYRRDYELLNETQWRSVILDEAQNIKNFRSKTAQLIKKLKADQRWALTGTPLENHLSELWSIFDFLMPGFLGGYAHFRKKYQQPIEEAKKPEPLQHLSRRIFPFVLRRVKGEVAKELPPKTEITHYCEMTHEQQKIYHEVLAAARRNVFHDVEAKGIAKSQFSILTGLLRLRQVCCHPYLLGPQFQKHEIHSGKMEEFKSLVEEVVSEGHRILVFSQFVEMLSLHRKWLEKTDIRYEYLDGRTRKRELRIKNFNQDPNIPIFLVSLRAGGTGLNLTGADYVIHYDPWWNPAVEDQATDRAHRIGQTKHVFSYKLITKNSVEEKILSLQENKKSLAKGLLGVDSALGKQLKMEDLEYLFS